ncbi:MAG: hypothetical protein ACK4UT_00665, partial [Moraxellaceae bacterium]
IALMASLTHANASLWGNDTLLAETWRKEKNTLRAELLYINTAYSLGNIDLAKQALQKTSADYPRQVGTLISLAYIDCLHFDTDFDAAPIIRLGREADFENASLEILERLRDPEQRKP